MMARFYLFLTGVFFLLNACNKADITGSDILPPQDNVDVLFTDTLSIISGTALDTVVRVYDVDFNNQLALYLCGKLDDPAFGTSESEIFTQFRLSTTNPDFTDVVFDSLMLSLAYAVDGHSGEFSMPQTYHVYRINEDLDAAATYYSDQTFGVDPVAVGSLVGHIPNFTDSVTVDGEKQFPQMRIPLDAAFANDLLDPNNASAYTTTSDFLNFFKGLNIQPDPSNTAMVRFNFASPDTRLSLYYSSISFRDSFTIDMVTMDTTFVIDPMTSLPYQVEVKTPRFFNMIINSQTAKTVHFEQDPSLGTVQSYLDGTASNPQELSFIQGMEGLNATVEFPYAEEIDDVIVNKAELEVFIAAPEDSLLYPYPPQLIVTKKDSDGELVLIGDVLVSLNASGNFQVFGGTPTLDTDGVNSFYKYTLNLSGHFQDIIDGIENEKIFISIFPREESATRVILGGSQNATQQMKLNLIYTKI